MPERFSTSNPWPALPTEPPFVLPDDQPIVEAFNRRANDDARLELGLLPEPYVGRPDAPILILLLNPGVSDEDFALHEQADFRARIRACHRQESVDYPNYYLDPDVTGPGARWMARITAPLLKEFGARAVADAVATLEYLPYHSRGFAHHRLRVPSQEYAFDLLRAALRRDTVVLVTRGRGIWEAAVPELGAYSRAFGTRSRQNVVISAKNCPDAFELARAVLRVQEVNQST